MAKDKVAEGTLTPENMEDWHFLLFNADYYIVGYYQAEQWLEKHNRSPFTAISYCQYYEESNFGESVKMYDNAETTVNMLAYILGEEWLYQEDGTEYIKELILDSMRENVIIVTDRASLKPIDLLDSWFGYVSAKDETSLLSAAVDRTEPFLGIGWMRKTCFPHNLTSRCGCGLVWDRNPTQRLN